VRRGYPGDPNEARTVGLVDVGTGCLELLALPDPTANQVVGFDWSSRGELLIDRASDTNVDRWLDVVDPVTGKRREAWHGHRATRVYTAFSSAWHPDGEHILFSSDREDRYGLYRLDPASGELRRLTQPGHDLLGDFTVLASSRSVVYEANDPSPYERQVFAVDADGGTPRRLTFAAGSNEAFPSPDGEVIAFLHSDDSSPAELWHAPAGSRDANRLTVSPPAEFREAFLTDFAGGDVEDVASAAAYMSSLPWVDPDRLGLWGSSYGGTLTVFSLLKKPGLYRAGVAAAAAVDARFFGPDDIAIVRYPDTHPAIFERTALSYAANLEDHLLFIHGLRDQVVPFKTTAVVAEELMRHGKDFEFAFAPGASHRWTRESHHAHYLLGRRLIRTPKIG